MQSEVLRGPRAAHQTKDIPPCRYRPAGSPPSTDERSLPTGPLRQRSRATPDEGRNQWSSVVISGHQGRQRQRSRATPDEGRNQWSSVVIRDGRGSDREPHLMRDAISGHQWSSEDRSCEIHTCCHAPCAGSRSAIDRDCSRDCERARCSPAGREAVRSGLPRLASAPFWVAASNACAASSLMREAVRGHQWSSEAMHAPRAA